MSAVGVTLQPRETEHRLVGTFEWRDEKQMAIQGLYDRVAYHNKRLVMISLVASVSEIKAMRAAIGSECKNSMSFTAPDGSEAGTGLYADDQGYTVAVHRLPYGTAHAVFISRRPGLLLNDSDAALWAELKDPRFSTPMLPSWLKYLRGVLEIGGQLFDCKRVGCTCRILTATTAELDAYVEAGLKLGNIRIEEEK